MAETPKDYSAIIFSSPPGCRPQLGGLISPQGKKSGFDYISFEHKHNVLMLVVIGTYFNDKPTSFNWVIPFSSCPC